MDSGYFSFSGGADSTERLMNSQQDQSNRVLPTSLVSSQYHHPIAPMNQINEPEPSYPEAVEVVALSPNTLLDGKKHVCNLCFKGFQREQNLTLHRRVHNLPFHLKRTPKDAVIPRKVFLCPEPTCINHNRTHALGDFGGLKKHYLRKHSIEKKHKCVTCYKTYAVASDLRAHSKNCSIKKYNCDCGAGFSSHSKFKDHLEFCDALVREDAAKNTPNSDMINSSQRSISNKNITTSMINSTKPYLPSSYMGNNSSTNIRNINNKNNNHHLIIGSNTTSYMPISAMGSNNNIINNINTNSTMSHLPTFNMGNKSLQSITNNMFPLSSTQQNQYGQFQENSGTGYFTNLMVNNEYDQNMNHVNTNCFMGDGSYYGNGEGSNLLSGYSGSEIGGFSIQEEHSNIPFGTPNNIVANKDLCGSIYNNGSAFTMVQPYANFSSTGGGSFMPQKQNFVFEDDQLNIPENRGFYEILNSLRSPITGSGVGSPFMNENVDSGYQYQGNYYGNYVDESRYNDYGATSGGVGPYGDQQHYYWNDSVGSL